MKKAEIKHLGLILDGNRRWARKRGLSTLLGHKKGLEKVLKIGDWCFDRGIQVLTVWAFSTENWKRSKKEVGYLMKLIRQALQKEFLAFHKKGIRIQVLGRLKQLPEELQAACQEAMALTKSNTKAVLNIAVNYGGQAEIIDAVNRIIKGKVKKVTPESFQKYLYDPQMPPADLIIRTSGEQRTSGFLLWESAYSELYFVKHCLPDFNERDLDQALEAYRKRQRRFGGN